MLTDHLVEEVPSGYPRVAMLQSNDTAYFQYRRFSYLHSRVLFEAQFDLENLERELNALDEDHDIEDPERLRSIDYDRSTARVTDEHVAHRSRSQILADLRQKLFAYGTLSGIQLRPLHLY